MREHFKKELEILESMCIDMGKKVQRVIRLAVESLREQDLDKANAAILMDDEVDQLEIEIESKCLLLIALQQPIAKDLRRVGTVLKIITDLERIGDYGVNIAKAVLDNAEAVQSEPFKNLTKTIEIVEDMLDKSIESFIKENVHMARYVIEMDDHVDQLHKDITREVEKILANDASATKSATSCLLLTRYLERMADHTTNICERVIYMVTGERVEID